MTMTSISVLSILLILLNTSTSFVKHKSQSFALYQLSLSLSSPAMASYDQEYVKMPLNELLHNIPDVQLEKTFVDSFDRTKLTNTYYGLRHGESEANVEGIISSDPTTGSTKHRLTSVGKSQARKSATQLIDMIGRESVNADSVVFISSNFTRARETAFECIKAIDHIRTFEDASLVSTVSKYDAKSFPLVVNNDLRERYFGNLDALPLVWYNRVWPVDRINVNNKQYGVEAVSEVVKRIASMVSNLEKQYSSKHIVLVSHADTLQIAQTFLSGNEVRNYASYRFKNGEIRLMTELDTVSTYADIVYK